MHQAISKIKIHINFTKKYYLIGSEDGAPELIIPEAFVVMTKYTSSVKTPAGLADLTLPLTFKAHLPV